MSKIHVFGDQPAPNGARDWIAECVEHEWLTVAPDQEYAYEAAAGHAAMWHPAPPTKARVALADALIEAAHRVQIYRVTHFDHPAEDYHAEPPLCHDYPTEVTC